MLNKFIPVFAKTITVFIGDLFTVHRPVAVFVRRDRYLITVLILQDDLKIGARVVVIRAWLNIDGCSVFVRVNMDAVIVQMDVAIFIDVAITTPPHVLPERVDVVLICRQVGIRTADVDVYASAAITNDVDVRPNVDAIRWQAAA